MKKAILSTVLAAGFLLGSGTAAAAPTQYITNSTDTLWIISKKFNVKLSDLMAANPHIDPLNVYAGLVVNIPYTSATKPSWEIKADAIIATGMALLGTPYVFGGSSPNVGFDCSGFVQYVFNKHGFNLPHSSEMISKLGTPVSKSNLRKGDLVFLHGTYKSGVSHVAIYIGNNKILHAGTIGKREVKISTFFGTPYYDAHYWGARRIIY